MTGLMDLLSLYYPWNRYSLPFPPPSLLLFRALASLPIFPFRLLRRSARETDLQQLKIENAPEMMEVLNNETLLFRSSSSIQYCSMPFPTSKNKQEIIK